MREPLSENARKVIEKSQQEARALNQEFVSTEHLMLAILDVGGTHASRLLRQHSVDKDALRSQIRSVLPFSENPPAVTGALPLSPKAQRVINNALVMARSLREDIVSTRLLLAAVLDESKTTALAAIRQMGVDTEALLQALAQKPAEPEP